VSVVLTFQNAGVHLTVQFSSANSICTRPRSVTSTKVPESRRKMRRTEYLFGIDLMQVRSSLADKHACNTVQSVIEAHVLYFVDRQTPD
jgi:hypothetical protein